MNSRVGEGDLRIWGLICGELGLGAILPMVLQYHGYCPQGFAHGRQERRFSF
jgi:hypothetical protein